MSRYRMKKRLARVGDQVDDFIDEASGAYDSLRSEASRKARDLKGRMYLVKDRAEDAWDNREDFVDDFTDGLVSAGEYAASFVSRRFRSDPVGTIAVGAILFWVAGRMTRR